MEPSRSLIRLGLAAPALPWCRAAEPAELAASIQYETVPAPAGLSSDFQPREGIGLKFLGIKAIDGSRVEAAWWQPEGSPLRRAKCMLTRLMRTSAGGNNVRAVAVGNPSGPVSKRDTCSSLQKRSANMISLSVNGRSHQVDVDP